VTAHETIQSPVPQGVAIQLICFSMECSECSRLRAEHDRLKGINSLAKLQLQEGGARGVLPVEYGALLGATNTAWLDAEASRLALELHRRVLSPL
jgi:hypothetical protein